MAKGIIGTVGFQERMNKKVIEVRRTKKGKAKKIVCYDLILQDNTRAVPDLLDLQSDFQAFIKTRFDDTVLEWCLFSYDISNRYAKSRM